MKRFYTLVMLVSLYASLTFAQVLEIHSIDAARETAGDTGYTLNGLHMLDYSTAKLLNTDLFGNTYPKTVNITYGYESSGSLELIGFTPDIDLFIFGTFNKLNPDFIPFTQAEIDSVYAWSKAGGKMIVGASAAYEFSGFDPGNLDEKWGFDIEALDPGVPFIATNPGSSTTIFDGPFGIVLNAFPPFQGGGAQGYFSTIPEGAIIIAEDGNDNPTLILDCTTLDLIIADFDGYTGLGGVSFGNTLMTSNDVFWTNSIAYMDELEDPPSVVIDGSTLFTQAPYNTYQWYKDGVLVDGANQQSFEPSEDGNYSVEVNMECGCTYRSDELAFVITGINELILNEQVLLSPNPTKDQLRLEFELLEGNTNIQFGIYNSLGQELVEYQKFERFDQGLQQVSFDVNKLSVGIYSLLMQTEEGVKMISFAKQ